MALDGFLFPHNKQTNLEIMVVSLLSKAQDPFIFLLSLPSKCYSVAL